ncbi:hypothetical protein [Plantactinospora sp. B5E13]|uniref:hypothetical protein n=1 Tax=unclassified Plantactinospora TaxID=2631981 RepID=UPI00325DCE47
MEFPGLPRPDPSPQRGSFPLPVPGYGAMTAADRSGGPSDPRNPYARKPAVAANTHLPQRPLWLCRVCVVDWPCLAARSLLTVEYVDDPVALHVYLATMLQAAVDDLYRLNPDPGPDTGQLYQRFLAWARPRLDIERNRRHSI